MVLEIILLLVGIVLVLWGADRFTDGASGLARKWHVSELVIGLTIVAAGTSLPEKCRHEHRQHHRQQHLQ